MKTIPWIITLITFAVAVAMVVLKKPATVTYQAPKCPVCEICPADKSTEVLALKEEISRLQAENLSLRNASAKKSRVTYKPVAIASQDATEEAKDFAHKLDTCAGELDLAQAVIEEYAKSDQIIRGENALLRSNLLIAQNNIQSLLDNKPAETEYIPDAIIEPPVLAYKKNTIHLGVGYLDKPFYSAGYYRNLRSWFAVGGELLMNQDKKFGAQGALQIKF